MQMGHATLRIFDVPVEQIILSDHHVVQISVGK